MWAIYFTPPEDHRLTRVASTWLGRNAFSGEAGDVAHHHDELLASPRKYGFHGTLKAPFRLAEAVNETEMLDAFRSFCAQTRRIPVVKLKVGALGPFLALVPADDETSDLDALAAACVKQFEPFRAPLTPAEIERRNPAKLSDRQREHLQRYGYPYVLDAFRFHMTLTGPIDDEDERAQILSALENQFEDALSQPLVFETLALFVEPEQGGPFQVLDFAYLNAMNNDKNQAETA